MQVDLCSEILLLENLVSVFTVFDELVAEIRRLIADMTLLMQKLPTVLYGSIADEVTQELTGIVSKLTASFVPNWTEWEKKKVFRWS